MENIVDKFKNYAKELGVLYKTRRELDTLIGTYEQRLKELGASLELADGLEANYNKEPIVLNN
jgi:hypothetical protein